MANDSVNCLAGVDEAGLGPVLGPLVVAGIAMAGPAGHDPWNLLLENVSHDRHVKGKVRVADSKRVHHGTHGLERLEETVLTFLTAASDRVPRTLEDLLRLAHCDIARLKRCPWYANLALKLPLHNDRNEIELRGHLLARTLDANGIRVLGIALRAVDAGEFNELLAATNNKGEAHFAAYGDVIARLLRTLPTGAHLVADRAGSRLRYADDMRDLLPEATVTILHEGERVSNYAIAIDERQIKLTFTVEAEDRAFPTALASCFAKYLRELMLVVLNRWFSARCPGLEPTAGYWVDGHRFLDDVASLIETPDFPRKLLIRDR